MMRIYQTLAAPLLVFPLAISPIPAKATERLPRLFIIGDSTVSNPLPGQRGWGDELDAFFDASRLKVENRARGGRSSRTFRTEGIWQEVLNEMRAGDFLLIQFGHNDGGSLTGRRSRASLKGAGFETQAVTHPKTGEMEYVHTYGWYIRMYAAEASARGVIPIVLSPVPRNIWTNRHTVVRASNDYGKWAAEAAKAEVAFFIDLNERIAQCYEEMGPENVKSLYFDTDHTHTTLAGAQLNAAMVVEGLQELPGCRLREHLKD